jgi:6-phosphogluconolactonase
VSRPAVEIFSDPATLALVVAERLLTRLAELQEAGITPHVALTGGTIADAMHREVARQHSRPGLAHVDWRRVHLWWGDERWVPAASPDRNAGQAHHALLASLPIPAEHIHEIASADGGRTLAEGVSAYAHELALHWPGVFDLVLLGVGPDGHVASLFPGANLLEVTEDLVAGVTDSPKPPPERITLTLPALNRANDVWFLAAGAEKASAVTSALSQSLAETSLPAARVRGRASTAWFLEAAAASTYESARSSAQLRRQ